MSPPITATPPRAQPYLPPPATPVSDGQRAQTDPAQTTRTQSADSVAGPAKGTPPTAQSVEQWYQTANPTYRVGDAEIQSAPHFRMSNGFNGSQQACMGRIANDLLASNNGKLPPGVTVDMIGRVTAGRGSPTDIKRVTQSLIDSGKLGPATDASGTRISQDERVRELQWKYGIGLDCASYAQQGFMRSRGLDPYNPADRAKFGFKDKITDEGLDPTRLMQTGKFKEVGPENAKPGDLLLMKPAAPGEVGHATLVSGRRTVGAEEVPNLTKANGPGGEKALQDFFAKGPVTAVDLDSSWGAGPEGKALGSGVSRRTLLKNADGVWATQKPDGTIEITPKGPCDHPYGGTLRPKSEP